MATYPGVELAWITPAELRGDLKFSGTSSAFHSYSIPVHFGSRQGAFLYNARNLEEALDDFRPEIVLHEQEVYALSAVQVAYVAESRSIPLVMFVWENLHRSLALPRKWMTAYVLRRCSALIAGSSQADQVHRDWGFQGPVETIPTMGGRINLKPEFGRRGNPVLKVCYAGRLVGYKGVDCLLRAVAILHRNHLPIQCVVAGQGPELQKLTDLSGTLGIRHLVEFCGSLSGDGVASLFRQSDVLVLPSRRTPKWEEQFGRVLAEAMAEGTVTVGSRTGAIPEVIGTSELLFEEDDSNGLAEILRRLADDSDFFMANQRQLWMRAKEEFDNDILTARRIRFLQEILEHKAGG
jgi:glycosyltransferase involved in cell wall biosynthesis